MPASNQIQTGSATTPIEGRCGVIDVGTNSVKLLVAELRDHEVFPVIELGRQTRLGKGLYPSLRLQREGIQLTLEAVAEFVGIASSAGCSAVNCIATSAARSALNSEELLQPLRAVLGGDVHVLTGDEEAEWAYLGAISNLGGRQGPVLVLDVGGGSTELILGNAASVLFRHSTNLGAVRLFEEWMLGDPPAGPHLEAVLVHCRKTILAGTEELRRQLGGFPTPPMLIGTGGTAGILARVHLGLDDWDRERIDSTVISRAEVCSLAGRLGLMTLAERRRVPGLPAERGDIAPLGMLIVQAVMEVMGLTEFRASSRGVRFGAVIAIGRSGA